MSGIQNCIIRQFLKLLQGIKHVRSKLFLTHYSIQKIRPSYVAYKNGVSAKKTMFFSILVDQKITGRFKSMPGCMNCFN